jgi:hypothetical protein
VSFLAQSGATESGFLKDRDASGILIRIDYIADKFLLAGAIIQSKQFKSLGGMRYNQK